jgi:hypothetical protein
VAIASVLGGRISVAPQPGVVRHDACRDAVAGLGGHGNTAGLGTARLAVVWGADGAGAIVARTLARPTRSYDHALRGRKDFSRRFVVRVAHRLITDGRDEHGLQVRSQTLA